MVRVLDFEMKRELLVSEVPRLNVMGTRFSVLDLATAVKEVARGVESGGTGYVTVTNADGSVKAMDDEDLRGVYNGTFLTVPDGMPVVWVGKARGHAHMGRVYGPDLMLRLFLEGKRRVWKHYFYGGREGVADELKRCMERRFPGSEIVGTYCPPFRDLTEQEEHELIEDVARLKPDLFWVGISTPRQDVFMAKMLGKLDCGVMLGVGAAFDFHAGKVEQAPTWVQDAGLEWAFRLMKEPQRLWRRYASVVPRFAWNAGLQTLGMRSFDSSRKR